MKSWLLWMWCGDFPPGALGSWTILFAVVYVTAPMLDTMGLSGVPSLCTLGNP